MSNEKNKDKKQPVEVILVVPLGVEDVIFPWGVHSIKDFIENTCESVTVKLWDMRGDTFFAKLNERYSKTFRKLFFALDLEQMDTFFGTTTNPYIFLVLAACTGENFFEIAGISSRSLRSCADDLRKLQEEFEAYVSQKLKEYRKGSSDVKRIWGFSVYDRTLFNSLYFSQLVKKNDPAASVILGGDYFTFTSAETTSKAISFVDGIVVGYGEEVMKRIVMELQQGNPINSIQTRGLVNPGYFSETGKPRSLNAVCVPLSYEELSKKPAGSYVRRNEAGEIHILAQRGCSWGKCDFCAQIDKDMYYPISVDHLLEEVKEAISEIRADEKNEPIKISFDSDENSIEMITRFVQHLESIDAPGVEFDISLWFQVKSYRKKLIDVLSEIDRKKIRVHLMFNFESLNAETLRTMRKGHSPLQAIEGAKAILDSGHTFVTNYFTHYPLETNKSIAGETELLRRVVHLLMPPNGGGLFFSYAANDRDSIYHNQEKYKVKVRRLKGDSWLDDFFGVKLPFAVWAYAYDEVPSFRWGHPPVYSYYKMIKTRDSVYRPRQTADINWSSGENPFSERIAFGLRKGRAVFWSASHWLSKRISKGNSFAFRNILFLYISNVLNTAITTPDEQDALDGSCKLNTRMSSNVENVKPSSFYLEKGFLKKDYNIPGLKENRSLELDDNELKILRYLYWSRKRKKVIAQFKTEMTEAEVNEIIERHLELGSLVGFKGMLLCVVNDPECLK